MSAGKTVAIVQSNYIPWKGYFDLINLVDECILFDDMQYTRRDWRNRNRIKTPGGLIWLSIPVKAKHRYYQAIKDTEIDDAAWSERHWKTISQAYARAPYFQTYRDTFAALYDIVGQETLLSQVNYRFLTEICALLGIQTRLSWSMEYEVVEGKTERLVGLCQQAGATHYLSGPAARDYIDPALFDEAGITLAYMDYTGYPEYAQLTTPFEHGVSILDLLFNMGPDAPRYMKSFAS
jgi:hypothetical protein